MAPFINKTLNTHCLHNMNDFGGVIDIPDYYENPVLVSSIDGVGSKSAMLSKFNKIAYLIGGQDIVAHSINDILVKGANPLFFLDYIASDKLDKQKILDTIKGMSEVCTKYNLPILGGETAEMPFTYKKDEMDIAGCIIGIMEREKIINGKQNIHYDDIVVGLPSNGLHTNGYSLIKYLYDIHDIHGNHGNHNLLFDEPFKKWLSQPHKCYYDEIRMLDNIRINGLVHITGGGLIDNPPRVLTSDKSINLYKKHLDFEQSQDGHFYKKIKTYANIDDTEMYRTFNCGVGMLIILDKVNFSRLQTIYNSHNIKYYELGYIGNKNIKNNKVNFI